MTGEPKDRFQKSESVAGKAVDGFLSAVIALIHSATPLRIGTEITVVAEVVRLRSELSRVRLRLTVISAPVLTCEAWSFETEPV